MPTAPLRVTEEAVTFFFSMVRWTPQALQKVETTRRGSY
jgi:hypothetical protein